MFLSIQVRYFTGSYFPLRPGCLRRAGFPCGLCLRSIEDTWVVHYYLSVYSPPFLVYTYLYCGFCGLVNPSICYLTGVDPSGCFVVTTDQQERLPYSVESLPRLVSNSLVVLRSPGLITPVSESALAVPLGALPDESHRAAFSSSVNVLLTGRSVISTGTTGHERAHASSGSAA